MQVDERTRTAIDRLTSNERECLRRRLLPQTAKEMAADLGVSPHAVEKRLKMARAKLGVSSSLAAARLLVAAVEPGQPLAPQSPALPPSAVPGEQERVAHRPTGVFPMPMLLALIVAALPQSSTPLPPAPRAASEGGLFEDGRPIATRKVDADEAAAFIDEGFDAKDEDHSGFLDPREASAMEPRSPAERDRALASPTPETADAAAERKWMAKLDTDRDGRVSRAEYVGYMLPWILWQGVPADWHPKR